MQRRMGDPGGIDEDILLTFEEEDSHEKLRLPTLTLYTGQRLISSLPQHLSNNHKPSVNLHLSLGGSYSNSSSSTHHHHNHHAAAVDNNNIASQMMKRSYLDQNNNLDQMPPLPRAHQQEIILIDDHDHIDWAASSASENRALLRALHIIKSESCITTTHHKSKTSSSHQNQGVAFQEEVEGVIGNSMMNPDDFLSINLDDENISAFKDTSSSSSSTTSPPENNIRLLFPTHQDKGKSAPPIPNYYDYYYYYYNNIIAPQGGAFLGSTKSPRKENPMIMHYHQDQDHTYMAAAPPPSFAFASNHHGSNVPILGPRFPIPGALMKKNEYVRDSEIEMIRHMPTVATDGGIPGGRRVEGFLYRYSKYEDVIIVCFCHGRFFSPKEFVMHAAGVTTATTEFQNPMRLITIVSHD